ncbi:hypothetical protein [Streptomyces sp. NPDC059783]|uniref:hypothetical protein n=1 Tax=Streptomyces sp. NPDC059783 TaxID=3346944 RepID=UPI003656B682
MPAYVISPADTKQGDVCIDDPELKLDLGPHWAVLSTPDGIAYAMPTAQVAAIQRLDDEPHEE